MSSGQKDRVPARAGSPRCNAARWFVSEVRHDVAPLARPLAEKAEIRVGMRRCASMAGYGFAYAHVRMAGTIYAVVGCTVAGSTQLAG